MAGAILQASMAFDLYFSSFSFSPLAEALGSQPFHCFSASQLCFLSVSVLTLPVCLPRLSALSSFAIEVFRRVGSFPGFSTWQACLLYSCSVSPVWVMRQSEETCCEWLTSPFPHPSQNKRTAIEVAFMSITAWQTLLYRARHKDTVEVCGPLNPHPGQAWHPVTIGQWEVDGEGELMSPLPSPSACLGFARAKQTP